MVIIAIKKNKKKWCNSFNLIANLSDTILTVMSKVDIYLSSAVAQIVANHSRHLQVLQDGKDRYCQISPNHNLSVRMYEKPSPV